MDRQVRGCCRPPGRVSSRRERAPMGPGGARILAALDARPVGLPRGVQGPSGCRRRVLLLRLGRDLNAGAHRPGTGRRQAPGSRRGLPGHQRGQPVLPRGIRQGLELPVPAPERRPPRDHPCLRRAGPGTQRGLPLHLRGGPGRRASLGAVGGPADGSRRCRGPARPRRDRAVAATGLSSAAGQTVRVAARASPERVIG